MTSDRTRRGLFVVHIGFCLLLMGFFYRPLFEPDKLLHNADMSELFWPARLLATRAQAADAVPLWSEWQFFGAPFHAGLQGGALYPPLWIARAALGGDPSVEQVSLSLMIELLAHVLWMATGLVWLLRREYGSSREASLLAGLALALSSWTASHLAHVNQLEATAWAPWIIGLARRLAREGRTETALWLAGALAMALLAGHPQGLYYTLLFSGFCLPAWLHLGKPSQGEALRRLTLFGLGGGLALGLAGAQLVPTLEAARHAWTIAEGEDYALALAMPPVGFIGYVAPWLFGSPAKGASPGFDGWAFHEFTIYFGLVSIPLAVAGFVTALHGKWRPAAIGRHRELVPLGRLEALSMAAAWAFAAAVAVGDKTPLFALASDWLPLFGKLRAHVRALMMGHFAMLIFGARGFDEILGALAARRKRTRGERVAVRKNPPRLETLTFLGLASFLALDLWTGSWGLEFRHAAPFEPGLTDSPLVRALKDDPRRAAGPYRVYWLIRDDLYFEGGEGGHFARAAQLTPNNNIADGVELSHGYGESLRPTLRQRDLLYTFHRNFMSPQPDLDLFRLLNCSHIITDIRGPVGLGGRPAASLRRPADLAPLRLMPVEDPLPRVVTRQKAREMSRPEGVDLAALLESFEGAWRTHGIPLRGYQTSAIDLKQYLEDFGPDPASLAIDDAPSTASEVIPAPRPTWNRQGFRVEGDPARDVYHIASAYPGWRLQRWLPDGSREWLDEIPNPVSAVAWRVSGPLEPGDYEFVYAPDSFELGKAISFASASAWACLLTFFWRRRKLRQSN